MSDQSDNEKIDKFNNQYKIKFLPESAKKMIRLLKTIDVKVLKYLPSYREFNTKYKEQKKNNNTDNFTINRTELTDEEKKQIETIFKESEIIKLFDLDENGESVLFNIIKYGTSCLNKLTVKPLKPHVDKVMDYFYYYPKIVEYIGENLEERIPIKYVRYIPENPMNKAIFEYLKHYDQSQLEKIFGGSFTINQSKDQHYLLKGLNSSLDFEISKEDFDSFNHFECPIGIITYILSNYNIAREETICTVKGTSCQICGSENRSCVKSLDYNDDLNKRNSIICCLLLGSNKIYNESKKLTDDVKKLINSELKMNKICGNCINDSKMDLSSHENENNNEKENNGIQPEENKTETKLPELSSQDLKELKQFKDFKQSVCVPELEDYKQQTTFEMKEMEESHGETRENLKKAEQKIAELLNPPKKPSFLRRMIGRKGGTLKKRSIKRKQKSKSSTKKKKKNQTKRKSRSKK